MVFFNEGFNHYPTKPQGHKNDCKPVFVVTERYKVNQDEKNVILIDDDIELTDLLKAYLEKQGYAVTAFNDPALGIQGLQKGDFDFVITRCDDASPGWFRSTKKKSERFSTIPHHYANRQRR